MKRWWRAWRQGRPSPAGGEESGRQQDLTIYDALAAPTSPDFLGLGGLLCALVLQQHRWIYRRVETLLLVEERRFRRQMSVDYHIDPLIVTAAEELGIQNFPVPLMMLEKRPLVSFDLRDGRGDGIPLLTRQQTWAASRALLIAAMTELAVRLKMPTIAAVDDELDAALREVVETPAVSAEGVLGLLRRRIIADGRHREAEVDELLQDVNWLVNLVDTRFLLLADLPLATLKARRIAKVSDEYVRRVRFRNLGAALGWRATSLVVRIPEVTRCGSYHFEFVPPSGLDVVSASFVNERDARFGRPSPPSDAVVGLNTTREELPHGSEVVDARVSVRPSRQGLLNPALLTAWFSAALLGLLSLVPWIEARIHQDPSVEGPTLLLLVVPGLIAAFLARPGEHVLVSRLLRSTRVSSLLSGLCLFVAAGVLVLKVAGDAARLWWLALWILALSSFFNLLVVWAARRARSS